MTDITHIIGGGTWRTESVSTLRSGKLLSFSLSESIVVVDDFFFFFLNNKYVEINFFNKDVK